MSVDSHVLNKIIVHYSFPIPRLDGMLDNLSGSTIFSKIDFLKVDAIRFTSSQETSGRLHSKHVEDYMSGLLCPMVFYNTPSTFTRVMNETFYPYIGKFFVDGILVYSQDHASHLEHR